VDRLVYFERFGKIRSAIAREKQIKGLSRLKKMALIVSMNPEWRDLSEGWYDRHRYQPDEAVSIRSE
jgi:putative endonuclease